jgi:soluble lytic murein transglycosylase-like protein
MGAALICNTWGFTPTHAQTENLNVVSEGEDIQKALVELEEISKIQYKIVYLNRHINLELSYKIADAVYKHSRENNKDIDMVLAIIRVESYFNPRAKSPAGACGLMQIMPFWAKEFGIEIKDLCYNIDTNINCGIKILMSYEKLFKRYDLVLTTYNKGPKQVKKDIREGKDPRTKYSTDIIRAYNKLKKIDFEKAYVAAK